MNTNQIIDNLKLLGVKTASVCYSGGGDNGGIDSIDVITDGGNQSRTLEDHLREFKPDSDEKIALRVAGRLLGEKVTEFEHSMTDWAYRLLDEVDIPDWVNNEGGSGTITVYVDEEPGQQIRVRHNANNDDAEYDDNWEETKPCTTTESVHWL